MAAVRERSSQKVLRASGETAMKPSPLRALASRTMRDAAAAQAASLSEPTWATSTLGGVADGAHVAFVEVLEAAQLDLGIALEVLDDLDDGRHRLAQVLAIELQADRAHVLRHPVQDEGGRGD